MGAWATSKVTWVPVFRAALSVIHLRADAVVVLNFVVLNHINKHLPKCFAMVKFKWLKPESLSPLLCFEIALCSQQAFPLGASVCGHDWWSLSLLSASFSEAVLRVCVGWFGLMALLWFSEMSTSCEWINAWYEVVNMRTEVELESTSPRFLALLLMFTAGDAPLLLPSKPECASVPGLQPSGPFFPH